MRLSGLDLLPKICHKKQDNFAYQFQESINLLLKVKHYILPLA
jgi:hypothetical protein